MGSFLRPPLDFTVSREDWCRYDLSDDSILKIKLLATKIRKKNTNYNIDIQNVIVVLSNERGQEDSKSYTSLDVWKKSRELTSNSYTFTKKYPKVELYGLTNQLRRCVV